MEVPHKCVTVTVGLPAYKHAFADTRGCGKACKAPVPTGLFLEYLMDKRFYNGKLLRCGYTTGTCAAAATRAAALMLLGKAPVEMVDIRTPNGYELQLNVLDTRQSADEASCAIRKDAGDDPDVTDGVLVYSRVRRSKAGIAIDGGAGVGRVTQPGLDQPVGSAAINSVPRDMIRREAERTRTECGYTGGLDITISIPDGERLAGRTFNPYLGIEGGISVLGTSGIVEPMSEAALVDTLRAEMSMLRETGEENLLICIGNYAEDFAKSRLGLGAQPGVKCSNFIGDAIASAAELGFKKLLLIGHVGKLVKLGIGLMNTHSSHGDGRMETLAACALQAGADIQLLRAMMDCVTTDAAISLLGKAGLLDGCMAELGRRIEHHIGRRLLPDMQCGFVCFTNGEPHAGVLVQSADAGQLMDIWRV